MQVYMHTTYANSKESIFISPYFTAQTLSDLKVKAYYSFENKAGVQNLIHLLAYRFWNKLTQVTDSIQINSHWMTIIAQRQRSFQAVSCHTKTMAMTEMMDPFVLFLLFVLCNSLNDLINSILQSGDRSALSGSEVTVRGQRLNLVFKLKTLQNTVDTGSLLLVYIGS